MYKVKEELIEKGIDNDYNIKRLESLILWNLLSEMCKEKFNEGLGYSFNDLYNVKEGIVRRMDSGLSGWWEDIDKFNIKFNKVKKFIEGIDWNKYGFKVEFNKEMCYSKWYYRRRKNEDINSKNYFEGNWEDYKKYVIYNESNCIIKIVMLYDGFEKRLNLEDFGYKLKGEFGRRNSCVVKI